MLKKVSKLFSQNSIAILLVALGSFSWILTMFKSGLIYGFGMGFWGANGHDGVWHIALAQSLARGSWDMPTFAGVALKNYHVGFDLLLAGLHKITSIPITNLYFQVLPVLMSLAIGVLTYIFVLFWKKSKQQALWSVFFIYFAGGWGWLIGKGESAFWSQQSVSTLINPPFAMSLIFLLIGLVCLIKLQKKYSLFYFLCAVLVFGLLIQIKAYAGVLALGGLFVSGIYSYLKNKKLSILKIWLFSSILSLILFLPLNKLSSGLLVWQPFWFLETMMGLSDRVGWQRFYEAMVNYRLGNSIKAIPAYLVAFLIFWFGNLGMRAVKELLVIRWVFKPKQIATTEIFLSSVIVAGVFLPMLFLQKGTPWNTIQFLYYSLFFSSILAGTFIGEFLKNRNSKFKIIFSVFIILITIPTTLITLSNHYLPSRPPAMISDEELEALKFLSLKPDGVVLTYPFDKSRADAAVNNPPRPLYLYESTAYVSAFANKPVFLEDQVNLDITGYDWQSRREQVDQFYTSLDDSFVYNFLRGNSIKYVYWLKPLPAQAGQRATLGETQLGLERIFENSEVDIYIVK